MKIRRVLIYEGNARDIVRTLDRNAVQGRVDHGGLTIREEEVTVLEREDGACQGCGRARHEHHEFKEGAVDASSD